MSYPKVLVSSIDVWNTDSGSDTFTNLLSGYDASRVANIYFRSGIPTSTAADKFFFISENAVIKSIFQKSIITGWDVQQVGNEDVKKQMDECKKTEIKRYSYLAKHRWWLFIFVREFLWKIGKWNSNELEKFLDDYKPDLLFCPVESYIHFNRVNEYIIEKTGIPLITYMWDDNFSYKGCTSLGAYLHRFFLRKSVKKILKKSQKTFAISPKMQDELKDVFSIETELLTKGGIIKEKINNFRTINSPLKMVYTGKLAYGRLETIQLVSKIIGKINQNEVKIQFEIYTGSVLNKKDLVKLGEPGVIFCGSVSQDKIADIHNGADLLLLVEALTSKHKYDARLSFSTKVVDYLLAGKCIVAVGAKDIASIEYLKDNNAALCVSSSEELEILFMNTINSNVIEKYSINAQELVKEKHDMIRIQNKLYSTFNNFGKHQML